MSWLAVNGYLPARILAGLAVFTVLAVVGFFLLPSKVKVGAAPIPGGGVASAGRASRKPSTS